MDSTRQSVIATDREELILLRILLAVQRWLGGETSDEVFRLEVEWLVDERYKEPE